MKTLDKMPPRPTTWPISTRTSGFAAAVGPCTFRVWPVVQLFVLHERGSLRPQVERMPVEQVVEETIDLTGATTSKLLWMADDNFLVIYSARLQIAEGLIRKGEPSNGASRPRPTLLRA